MEPDFRHRVGDSILRVATGVRLVGAAPPTHTKPSSTGRGAAIWARLEVALSYSP